MRADMLQTFIFQNERENVDSEQLFKISKGKSAFIARNVVKDVKKYVFSDNVG